MEVKTVLPQSTEIFDILNPAHPKVGSNIRRGSIPRLIAKVG